MRALEGLLILDLTRLLPGAVATSWLREFGAEVVKIEQPGEGDYARSMNPPLFAATNAGKKSVALNLKDAAGREAFLKLCRRADVVIEGFRPGVMDKLGVGYEVLRQENPRIIFATLTGYGCEGPYKDLAGHDLNYLAMAGVLDQMGAKGGPPAMAGIQIADLAGGTMQMVIGILLALAARERTGEGQRVDVSMFHGMLAMLPVPMSIAQEGADPQRGDETLSGKYACYQVYEAAGGSHVAVGALEPKFWANLCNGLGVPELIRDQYAPEPRQSEIKNALAAKLKEKTAEEWFAMLGAKDTCLTPVRTVRQATPDLGSAAIPFLSRTPGEPGGSVPALGEHTAVLLEQAGYTADQIATLRASGAIA
jgi:crotonobetainyl-CoA:carnitine CoA-transferase CaiB-like acyl-CoA transferase